MQAPNPALGDCLDLGPYCLIERLLLPIYSTAFQTRPLRFSDFERSHGGGLPVAGRRRLPQTSEGALGFRGNTLA